MAEETTKTETPESGPDPGAGPGAGDERLAFRAPIQQVLTRPEIGALLGVMSVWILFWQASERFGTVGGTANFFDVAATLGIMAVPVALLMIGGEFDLSSGAMTGATAIMVVLLSKEIGEFGGAGLSLHIAVPLGLAFALIVGWFNGTMVDKTSLPSFIVTLGTFFVLIGGKLSFSKLFTNKVIVEGLDEAPGYEFWNDIFGAEWVRNSHVWDGRDWAWAILFVFGGAALLCGVLDLTFQRRQSGHPAGLAVSAAGVVIGVAGFAGLLTTSGAGADWGLGIVIAVGVLIGVWGWCRWRYAPAEKARGSADQRTLRMVGVGVAAVVIAMVVAAVMDSGNSERLDFLGHGLARFVFFVGIAVMGVLALLAAIGRVTPGMPLIGTAISAVPAVSYLVTVQAARVILFVVLAMGGLFVLAAAARRLRAVSAGGGLAVSLLTAAAMAGLALFIQSQGDSRKIRVELTAAILLAALAVAAMAVANFAGKQRTVDAPHAQLGGFTRAAGIASVAAIAVNLIGELADVGPSLIDVYPDEGVIFALVTSVAKGAVVGLVVYSVGVLYRLLFTSDEGAGRPLITVGATALGLGLASKLLFSTTLEAAATTAVTRFRVSVLYYLLFAAIGTWILTRTQFGSWTFAVGGNKDAARSVGVPAARTKTTLFMMVSVAAFVTGMVIAFRLNSVQSNVGDGNEFRYIIVAVVGGCLLTGGYGSAAGAALGALIWGMITQGIGFAGWNTDWRFLVLGFLLLVAVIVNNYVRGRAERMK